MSRAASSSSSSDTKSFWRRPRLPSQPNIAATGRFEGRPVIRIAAAQLPQRRLSSSPQQLSSDEEDEELRSFLSIRDPIPRHGRRRDDSPSSPASSYSSSRLSPWSTPTSPRWSGSTTPPGSSSLEGHSPGLSTSLSSSPFSEASIVSSRKNCPESTLSRHTSASTGSRLNLPDPPPPCNLWGGYKCPEQSARGPKKDDVSSQIADFWKYRRSSDVTADSDARKQRDEPYGAATEGRRSSYHVLEPPESDDGSTDVSKGARPKLPPQMKSPPKDHMDKVFVEPTDSSVGKDLCSHCKLLPRLLPLECCEEDVKSKADVGGPLATLGLKKGLNWPCTLQPPSQRCVDCLYSMPLSSGAQWVQASCGKFPWNRHRGSGVLVHEVDEGQPCLTCKDKCPGFSPHLWRKVCNNCKCPRESHDVYHEEFVNVRDRIGIKPDPSNQTSKEKTLQEGYSWVPPGLSSAKIEEYFSQLPNHKVPRLGTPGEKYRDRQLIVQLPKQDLALAYCKFMERECQRSFEDFVNARNEIALDIGYVREALEKTQECFKCGGVLPSGELAVIAPKFGELVAWHPACFVCAACQELLVDLTYCAKDGHLYCERHYAETLKPRCSACDELIFSGEYTKAMNKDWHSGHFCCWQCDESLTGQRYVLRDEHPYCVRCYEQVFANSCEECSKAIGIDSKDLSYKEKHWHEACFLCSKCRVSLVDKPFGSKAEKVYCASCYDAAFASRCDGCGEIFRAGTKKMEYKGHQWHDKCFCCCTCKNPIGTRSFIPRDNDIYCTTCYEEKFSTRCIKCNQIISSGGVTYRNEPWHRECFTCTNCSSSLAGQRFTSRDEKPYCAECFGELFAKRCTACSKPITGIGGTRFISFEDRNWHNDCFICAMCNNSLVGKGFITDGPEILCPECARQKLM